MEEKYNFNKVATTINTPLSSQMTNKSAQSFNIVLISTIAAVAVGSFVAIYLLKRFQKPKPNIVIRRQKGPITLVDSEVKYELPLIEKTEISHDTRRFVFGLPSKDHILGLPVGQHINISAKIDEKLVVRPYTPVSSDNDQGIVVLIIKVYFKNTHPNFPDGGKMSQYLNNLNIGDTVEFRGPSGLIIYRGNGYLEVRKDKKSNPELRHFNEIGLIAGGSGITPMLQIIYDVLKNPEDYTKIYLLYANQSEDDILLKKEIDDLAAKHLNRFKVWYTIDRPNDSDNWKYSTGYITVDMIEQHLPVRQNADFVSLPNVFGTPDDFSSILICGPSPMVKFACTPALDSLNFPLENRFLF